MCSSSAPASIAGVVAAIQGRARCIAGLAAAAALGGCGAAASPNAPSAPGRRQHASAAPAVLGLEATATGRLPEPVQDPATTAVGAEALLMGGLDSADTSTSRLVDAGPGGARAIGRLPHPLHDAAAATLGGRACLIGG